jgi:molybdate transport system substrate-binding protein
VVLGLLTSLITHALPLPAQRSVTVFAAASLTEAFGELGRRFEASHAGVRVRFNFAGTPQLALQIQQGARADLLASADERWMRVVRGKGLLRGEALLFARNRLVVILPRSNPGAIVRLADLARRGVKLVVAADAVPIGRYTQEVLQRLAATPGYGDAFATLVRANIVSYEDNVKGIVAKVALGEADAGVVYQSEAAGIARDRLRTLDIPEPANVSATYLLAELQGGSSPDLARAFVDLVLSATGQRLLARSGLLPASNAVGAFRP